MFNRSKSNKKEKGQGLVEYSLTLVLVGIVVIAALMVLGPEISCIFTEINNSLSGSTTSCSALPANGGAYGHWPNSSYGYCAGAAADTPHQLYYNNSTGDWISGAPGQTPPTGYIAHSMQPNYPTTCGAFTAQGHADTR
jgi:Flp pilus assembly pilin Flp